jgi:hypothetical protein
MAKGAFNMAYVRATALRSRLVRGTDWGQARERREGQLTTCTRQADFAESGASILVRVETKRMKPGALFLGLLAGGILFLTAPLHAQRVADRPADPPHLVESVRQLGSFTLGGQPFTATFHEQTISPTPKSGPASTVSGLDILDAGSNVVYQESFAVSYVDGRFAQTLSVSGSRLNAAGGQALVLRFLEDPSDSGGNETWQMFTLVNGTLKRYGAPLPLGQGTGTVNGVLTGVMLQGGIGVVPLASTAEPVEFQVWAGSFFVAVPVRIDWGSGQWSEAEECFVTEGGSLRPAGCNMKVSLGRLSISDGAVVTIYPQPKEDAYAARQIPLRTNSAIEFPAARARASWQNRGERFSCSFDDLWLHVRIDGADGWVHSPADFAALGLPPAGPAR